MGFRIEKETYKNKTLRLPEKLIDSCSKVAAQHEISFNELVIQALEYCLKNLEADDGLSLK